MITKKARKSSRFYNDKLKHSLGAIFENNRRTLVKQRSIDLRQTARALRDAPELTIPPIEVVKFAFRPRQVSWWRKLFRRAG